MTIRIRHDARLEFKVTADGRTLESRIITADQLDAACMLVGYMYNGLTVSGGVAWRDISTGRPISRPKIEYQLLDPKRDTLTGNQLCECARCLREEASA